MNRIAALKTAGPWVLGRMTGNYVVHNTHSGAVSVFGGDKAAAARAFDNRVANMRHAAPPAELALGDAERIAAVAHANAFLANSERDDRRVILGRA